MTLARFYYFFWLGIFSFVAGITVAGLVTPIDSELGAATGLATFICIYWELYRKGAVRRNSR
jgi:hypothetical protein